jgi:hypothetical protein
MDHYTIERFHLAKRVAASLPWHYFLTVAVAIAGFAILIARGQQ